MNNICKVCGSEAGDGYELCRAEVVNVWKDPMNEKDRVTYHAWK